MLEKQLEQEDLDMEIAAAKKKKMEEEKKKFKENQSRMSELKKKVAAKKQAKELLESEAIQVEEDCKEMGMTGKEYDLLYDNSAYKE